MSRRQRLPGTRSPVWRREVACGGRPQRALGRALDALPISGGEIWSIGIAHDDGCPSLTGGGMPACTCEVVRLEAPLHEPREVGQ